MRRIVEPERVLYLERHRGWSVILFASALALLGITPVVRHSDPDPFIGVLLIASVVLVAISIRLLLHKRAFVIGLKNHHLMIIERQLFSKQVRQIPLSDVSVSLNEVATEISSMKPGAGRWTHIESKITLRILPDEEIFFLDGVVGAEGAQLAERLAEDLRCAVTRKKGW